jgi:meso-butanediol dehydrogenase/(S,S)-butanediol dehydrogenase/diacetyl reductase
VTDADSCRAAVADTLQRHGRLDVLANVAGIIRPNRIADVTPDEWRRIIDVNLTGTFLLSQAALPALLETKGAIVNMASLSGIQAAPYQGAYSASKPGVIMLTKSMAIELAKTGVRVNAVCPNAVDTPLLSNIQMPDDVDVRLVMRSASPMGRVIAPSEVAAAVAYLASSEAANITGTTLVIDGGASV